MKTYPTEPSTCPACGLIAAQPAIYMETGKSYDERSFYSRILRCECGHGYLSPMPQPEDLSIFYNQSYHCYTKNPGEESRIEKWIEDRRVGDYFNHVRITPGGLFLDVGCGIGDMVAAMSRLGMKAKGVEPSTEASVAARKAGLDVMTGYLNDMALDNGIFNAISMFHVLEHVENPLGLLNECHRLLKPGGELTIGVPNLNSLVHALRGEDWIGLQLPTHVHHFVPNSLEVVGRRAGFVPLSIRTESLVEHVEGELISHLRKRWLVPQRISRWTGCLRPLARSMAKEGEAASRGESVVAIFVR